MVLDHLETEILETDRKSGAPGVLKVLSKTYVF
jgi:hypothetical protein